MAKDKPTDFYDEQQINASPIGDYENFIIKPKDLDLSSFNEKMIDRSILDDVLNIEPYIVNNDSDRIIDRDIYQDKFYDEDFGFRSRNRFIEDIPPEDQIIKRRNEYKPPIGIKYPIPIDSLGLGDEGKSSVKPSTGDSENNLETNKKRLLRKILASSIFSSLPYSDFRASDTSDFRASYTRETPNEINSKDKFYFDEFYEKPSRGTTIPFDITPSDVPEPTSPESRIRTNIPTPTTIPPTTVPPKSRIRTTIPPVTSPSNSPRTIPETTVPPTTIPRPNSLGGNNRLTGEEIFGPVDTPAEQTVSDAGGVAIMATDKFQEAVDKVDKKFGKTIIDDVTADYIDGIDGGSLSPNPEEVRSRLRNPRKFFDGRPYLADDSGDYFRNTENGVVADTSRISEPVQPEQADLIEAVAAERKNTEDSLVESDKAIEQLETTFRYLEKVIDGSISSDPAELRSRLRNPRKFYDGRPYLVDDSGDYFRNTENGVVADTSRISEPVQPEQADLIEAVAAEITDIRNKVSKEINSELSNALDSSIIRDLLEETIQRRSEMLTEAEVDSIDNDIKLLRDLAEIAGRLELASEFNEIVESDPIRALALLDDAQINEVEDTIFVNSFLKPVVASVLINRAAEEVLDPLCDDPIASIQAIKPLLERKYPQLTEQATEVISYALQRVLIEDYESVLEDLSLEELNFADRLEALQNLPIRPSLDDFDYTSERRKLIDQGTETLVKVRTAEIRQAFADEDQSADELLSQILDMDLVDGDDFKLQEELLEAYATYIIARRNDRPDDFKTVFSDLSERTQGLVKPELPASPELGKNLRAAKVLARNFKRVIAPIFQAMRANDSISEKVESFIKNDPNSLVSRKSFVIDTERLELQRDLTEVERDYLESVEALSIFNPHIAAILSEAPEVTQVALESYFFELSKRTFEGIQDGDYFPALLIGLGPNGVAALGEIMRLNPDLAMDVLAVDQALLPGGPFAVPKGVGWELNSANERGATEPTLPSSPDEIAKRTGVPEEQTVRAYGSPLPFYPGERLAEDKTSRPGSINTTVDYLPTPDDITQRKYATNEDLALIIQAQVAMLTVRMALSTQVVSVRPNNDPNSEGSKLVRLRMQGTDGRSREVEVQTDAVISSTGLGEPTFGFPVRFSRAEQVLNQTKNQPDNEFPLLTDTLGAFEALASKDGEQAMLGETLVIYGSGNSTATLAEYIGGIFADADNPSIRNVKKIYIVTDGSLSSRERYARIKDLQGRNGEGNLIEFVSGRVDDVALIEDRKVIVLDDRGRTLRNQAGQEIQANSVIASTGFRPNLSGIFNSYLPNGEPGRERTGLKKVVLPTNRKVAIAETLESDEDIILVGTGSDSGFQDKAKTEQLPPESASALIRNSVGNAVAIGFRRADDQAAMRLFVGESEERMAYRSERPKAEARVVSASALGVSGVEKGGSVEVGVVSPSLPKIRRDVRSQTSMLTPLLLKTLDGVRLEDTRNQSLKFDIVAKINDDGEFVIEAEYRGSTVDGVERVSDEFMGVVSEVVADPYFQAYWLKASSDRRDRNTAKLQFSFRNGTLDMQQTYAQPG